MVDQTADAAASGLVVKAWCQFRSRDSLMPSSPPIETSFADTTLGVVSVNLSVIGDLDAMAENEPSVAPNTSVQPSSASYGEGVVDIYGKAE